MFAIKQGKHTVLYFCWGFLVHYGNRIALELAHSFHLSNPAQSKKSVNLRNQGFIGRQEVCNNYFSFIVFKAFHLSKKRKIGLTSLRGRNLLLFCFDRRAKLNSEKLQLQIHSGLGFFLFVCLYLTLLFTPLTNTAIHESPVTCLVVLQPVFKNNYFLSSLPF